MTDRESQDGEPSILVTSRWTNASNWWPESLLPQGSWEFSQSLGTMKLNLLMLPLARAASKLLVSFLAVVPMGRSCARQSALGGVAKSST